MRLAITPAQAKMFYDAMGILNAGGGRLKDARVGDLHKIGESSIGSVVISEYVEIRIGETGWRMVELHKDKGAFAAAYGLMNN